MKIELPVKTRLAFPLKDKSPLASLRAGDWILISGKILAGRDQTHRRLLELLEADRPLPFNPQGQLIYYVGPTPAPPGRPIGSAGPTTSYRMDAYTPRLLELGVAATMGKGPRGPEVRKAMLQHQAIYLAAIGGAGAYLSRCIKDATPLAFEELGPEALLLLEVEDFPAVVINDLIGQDYYQLAREKWRS
ncbi:fumarate hydratase subunit beta [Thermosulfuriphilus ammonigenes]|uniref:FumA C-terminus/TtdB family hydratase beta subunit n=1 Tax=Thermosulfuriphilus ammonigenes TaxID=1936021 RepID=UPI00185C25AE|nr:FumA C-terminus/TtdB family hydratase beta subunit [Thermosulfuriphilus ammonigenes]MBA2847862.1 fumarate hydratase subunit beta [Thermosulfuriphilus ammonigenes]